jgi:hypothetical protein
MDLIRMIKPSCDRTDVCVSVCLCGIVKINSPTICLFQYERPRMVQSLRNTDLLKFELWETSTAKLVDLATRIAKLPVTLIFETVTGNVTVTLVKKNFPLTLISIKPTT